MKNICYNITEEKNMILDNVKERLNAKREEIDFIKECL